MNRFVNGCLATALILGSSLAVAQAAGGPHVSGFVLVALNPQPEPPGVTRTAESANVKPHTVFERVALNPQPEPPGITTDARVWLPPGPCRSVLVTVKTDGGHVFTVHASDSAVRGKCAFDVAVPGAKAGSTAAVTFGRDKLR